MQPREVQNCSFLRAQTPRFPGALGRSRALLGALGVSRVSLRDGPLAHEGPKTGQGRLGGPSRRSKRAQSRRKIALRRPRWPPDGPRGLQNAPRGLQEAFQEGPKKQKSWLFSGFLKVFEVLAILVSRRSKTAQEAPNILPRRPKRRPRRPPNSPRGPQDSPRGLQDRRRGPQDGSKRGPQEAPRGPHEAPKDPKRPQEAPRGPQEAPKRPQEAPKMPKRGPQEAYKRPQNDPQDASKLLPRDSRKTYH